MTRGPMRLADVIGDDNGAAERWLTAEAALSEGHCPFCLGHLAVATDEQKFNPSDDHGKVTIYALGHCPSCTVTWAAGNSSAGYPVLSCRGLLGSGQADSTLTYTNVTTQEPPDA